MPWRRYADWRLSAMSSMRLWHVALKPAPPYVGLVMPSSTTVSRAAQLVLMHGGLAKQQLLKLQNREKGGGKACLILRETRPIEIWH